MSGGFFNRSEWRLEDIACQIEDLIYRNGSTDKDEFGSELGANYQPEIINKFKETVRLLRRVGEMVQRIDYLVSGDDSEKSFLERWRE